MILVHLTTRDFRRTSDAYDQWPMHKSCIELVGTTIFFASRTTNPYALDVWDYTVTRGFSSYTWQRGVTVDLDGLWRTAVSGYERRLTT